MHQRRAVVLAVLMLTSSIVLLLNNEDNDAFSEINDNLYTPLDALFHLHFHLLGILGLRILLIKELNLV